MPVRLLLIIATIYHQVATQTEGWDEAAVVEEVVVVAAAAAAAVVVVAVVAQVAPETGNAPIRK